MRNRRITKKSAARGTVVVALALAACGRQADVRGEEFSRVEGQNVVALVTAEDGGGATVPRIYRVYLQDQQNHAEMLRAIKVQDLKVEWNAEGKLVIRISCGQILQFSNLYYRVNSDRKTAVPVAVLLDSGGPCLKAS